MLAGAAGIDIALLVVAADDGVMPQTVEHLAILEILNAKRGVVALTKIDLVDKETAELARMDVEDLLKGSSLERAAIIPCSTVTGEGVEKIRAELERLALMTPPKSSEGFFRMPVDRVFTIKGHGVVITGTVMSGVARIDDRVILSPGGAEGRIRMIQNHGVTAEASSAGSRTALNLAGVEKSGIRRGMVACHPAIARPSRMFTADIVCHRSSPHLIAHGRSYLLHVHTSETVCRVYLSSEKNLKPGEECVAQIRFDEPIQILHGDRFALRSPSARHTVGGGVVLEPGGHPMGRRGLLKYSNKWIALKDRTTGVRAFVEECPWGRRVDEIVWAFNLPEKQLQALCARLDDISVFEWKGAMYACVKGEADRIIGQIGAAAASFHKKNPAASGVEESAVLKTVLGHVDERLGAYWIRRAVAAGKVEQKGSTLRLPGYTAEFTGEDENMRSQILDLFQSGGFTPPKTDKAYSQLGLKREPVMKMIGHLIRAGDLVTLAPDYTLAGMFWRGLSRYCSTKSP